ncbi:23S rRNA m(5)U-1939 methyltransferase [Thalassoporum mexicanum PCC 7367]|uniref:23S rRNA (uracil(1939)-C(5))-methyltransferase RlmD n=1 Tax=Thalassoporum mexicanum TaxID=3457544 RepID=UPI00029FEBCF|nr:23S rRNA (uracil(1939)-C(5))-methyltransferase RlmD [Pseudanabaena sp. PCC 7367]AFY70538.1 23S rRNA m(5)U-1939 methyltransferase [Pseudanabaena sp. PCC 7367]
MQQGQTIELEITNLADSGDGVGRHENMAVFVANTVPGDRILARVSHVKRKFAHAILKEIITPSGDRVRPACIVADKCGGCQWQAVSYGAQLNAKQNQVVQALQRIGGFPADLIAQVLQPTLAAPESLHYRNKATYPLAIAPTGKVKAGYYQKGSHKLINLNQCPVQDARLDPLLAGIKIDLDHNIATQGWSIYQEKSHSGSLRHLSLRVGRSNGEVLLTLISTEKNLPGLQAQAEQWLATYPELVGVVLNYNPDRTNAIFGAESFCVAGQDYLTEKFADVMLRLRADTFFQIYTEQAEAILALIQRQLNLPSNQELTLVDAYAGIGTFTLPLAKQVAKAIAIEIQPQAIEQAKINGSINEINNLSFHTGKAEEILPLLDIQPDILLLDPPRKGCDRQLIEHLLGNSTQATQTTHQITSQPQLPHQIVYISCNPATLARDLKLLCDRGNYQINLVQPVDMFAQTAHVEVVAFLSNSSTSS